MKLVCRENNIRNPNVEIRKKSEYQRRKQTPMSVATSSPPINTLADLQDRLGGIPLNRIRFRPYPATVQDVIDLEAREGKLCELVDGVLVEKAVGYTESGLALYLAFLLNAFVLPRNLGIVSGADGTVELMAGLVRIPDVAFTRWDRLPGQRYPTAPVPRLAPNLAVEVLSRSNTPREMVLKRQDYFSVGVELVWEIDPVARTVDVYTSATQIATLTATDTLDGGSILPGFTLPLRDLFAELDRHG
jgi:Uma2 family endonuclease